MKPPGRLCFQFTGRVRCTEYNKQELQRTGRNELQLETSWIERTKGVQAARQTQPVTESNRNGVAGRLGQL